MAGMIGKRYQHVIDNYEAMGWRMTFTLSVEAHGLILQWRLELRAFGEIDLKDGGISVGSLGQEYNIGGTFHILWNQITPYPTADMPVDRIRLN